MKFLKSRVSHSAIMFASGLVIGGGLLGGLPRLAKAGLNEPARAVVQVQTDRCAGGDEVSSFVCRNTWMASTRYSHR
jgi:hypothetical protein